MFLLFSKKWVKSGFPKAIFRFFEKKKKKNMTSPRQPSQNGPRRMGIDFANENVRLRRAQVNLPQEHLQKCQGKPALDFYAQGQTPENNDQMNALSQDLGILNVVVGAAGVGWLNEANCPATTKHAPGLVNHSLEGLTTMRLKQGGNQIEALQATRKPEVLIAVGDRNTDKIHHVVVGELARTFNNNNAVTNNYAVFCGPVHAAAAQAVGALTYTEPTTFPVEPDKVFYIIPLRAAILAIAEHVTILLEESLDRNGNLEARLNNLQQQLQAELDRQQRQQPQQSQQVQQQLQQLQQRHDKEKVFWRRIGPVPLSFRSVPFRSNFGDRNDPGTERDPERTGTSASFV
jgi:hypothetical protein